LGHFATGNKEESNDKFKGGEGMSGEGRARERPGMRGRERRRNWKDMKD